MSLRPNKMALLDLLTSAICVYGISLSTAARRSASVDRVYRAVVSTWRPVCRQVDRQVDILVAQQVGHCHQAWPERSRRLSVSFAQAETPASVANVCLKVCGEIVPSSACLAYPAWRGQVVQDAPHA